MEEGSETATLILAGGDARKITRIVKGPCCNNSRLCVWRCSPGGVPSSGTGGASLRRTAGRQAGSCWHKNTCMQWNSRVRVIVFADFEPLCHVHVHVVPGGGVVVHLHGDSVRHVPREVKLGHQVLASLSGCEAAAREGGRGNTGGVKKKKVIVACSGGQAPSFTAVYIRYRQCIYRGAMFTLLPGLTVLIVGRKADHR